MTDAHTDGPWKANPAHSGIWDVLDSRGRDIVTVYGGGVDPKSREANAKIIAAAPEMLEALKECALQIAQTCNRKLTHGEESALDLARAAITKAEGKK